MILVYDPRDPQAEVMKVWKQKELAVAEALMIRTIPVESSIFGVTSPVQDLEGAVVFVRHYANQDRSFIKWIEASNGQLAVPRYNEANAWWNFTTSRTVEKYFKRNFGMIDLTGGPEPESMEWVQWIRNTLKTLIADHGSDGKIFLKTNKKGSLTARVYDLDDAFEMVTYWAGLSCHNIMQLLIWSEIIAIQEDTAQDYDRLEYRVFIVNDHCSTISLFTDTPKRSRNYADVHKFSTAFAQDLAGSLPHAYCLDIARLQDESLAVVELNDIAASGYFADHDLKRLFFDLAMTAEAKA